MSLNDFEVINRLGEGAYSSVYQVRRHADGEIYALKKVKMVKLSDKEKENALNEVRILASIKHQNISQYNESFIDEASSSLCIIMEYSDGGDLFQKITNHQKQQQYIQEDEIWKIFIQIVKGLRSLHEAKIFHRDLKSANIFLSKDGTAKLGDMNVSKVAKKGLLYTQTGTPYYASPEVWKDQPYDHKSDIWSLGCVLYESVTLKPPFRAEDMQGLYKKVLRGVYPKIPTIFSSELAQTIKFMVQVAPQMRPSCEKILDMPVVKKKCEKLFPEDFFFDEEPQMNLLSTIRVPKNLLYLTDRLPKPNYDADRSLREKEEMLRRRTYEGSQMLPDTDSHGSQERLQGNAKIDKTAALDTKSQKGRIDKLGKAGQSRGASYNEGSPSGAGAPIHHQDQLQEKQAKANSNAAAAVRKSRKQAQGDREHEADTEEAPAQKSLKNAASRATLGQDQKRKSQADNSSLGASGARGANNVRMSQNSKVSQKAKDALKTSKQGSLQKVGTPASVQRHKYDPDEYAEDGFEDVNELDKEEDHEPSQTKQSPDEKPAAQKKRGGQGPPPPHGIANGKAKGRISHEHDLEYSSHEGSPAKQHHGAQGVNQKKHREALERKALGRNGSKEQLEYAQNGQYDANQQSLHHAQLRENASSSNLLPPGANGGTKRKPPVPHGGNYKQSRNQKLAEMYGLAPDGTPLLPPMQPGSELGGQVHGKQQRNGIHGPQNNGHSNQPMAYVGVSSDGAKAVGPIGLKRAERELIQRRYNSKYHHQQDNIQRVALIYGQQTPQYNSHDRNYVHQGQANNEPHGVYPQRGPGGYYVSPNPGGNLNNGSYQSPYLVSVGSESRTNNAVNIIRRSKNYLDELKNQSSGYQVRLPKLTNMNKANHEYYLNQLRRNAQQGVLPPLVAGQSINAGGPGGAGPGGNQGYYERSKYHPGGHQGSSYQQNALRPSKLRSLNNKGQNIGNGLSGERIRLNHHGSQEKLSNYSGNYGSPHHDSRQQAAQEGYAAAQNQQYIDQVQQLNQRKIGNQNSKIGQGVLKQKGQALHNRVPSGQIQQRGSTNEKVGGASISPKKLNNNKVLNLQNHRQLNNNSNTSTNENSLPPRGHKVITANE